MIRLSPAIRISIYHGFSIAVSALLINAANPVAANLGWLAWVAFAPWLASLSGLRWRGALASGLLMGLAYIVPLHWSTFSAAIGAGGITGWHRDLMVSGFFASFAIPFALFGIAIARMPSSWRDSLVVWPMLQAGLLASLVSLVWSPFPYTPAVTQVGYPAVMQVLSLGGEPFLLALMLWPSALMAACWTAKPRWNQASRPLALISICLMAVVVFGYWRVSSYDDAEAGGLGISLSTLPLQLDLPPRASAMMLTRNRTGGNRSALELSLTAVEQNPQCEAAIWPELPLNPDQSRFVCGKGADLAQRLGLPLVMQCYRKRGDQLLLTAELFSPDPSHGDLPWHSKSSLVPFYEEPLMRKGGLAKGPPGTVFQIDQNRQVIPALCYELHSRKHLRAGVLNGGEMVFHMASFTPFDRQPIDVWDQAMAQLRAVEFGVPIVRSANRGPAGWIDANGRIRSASERLGRHAQCVDVWGPATGPTNYAYIAPIAGWLPGALMLLVVVLRRKARHDS